MEDERGIVNRMLIGSPDYCYFRRHKHPRTSVHERSTVCGCRCDRVDFAIRVERKGILVIIHHVVSQPIAFLLTYNDYVSRVSHAS